MKPVFLGDKPVGDGYNCYIIAEIGVSFKNFEEGKRLIDGAIKANVDAVKFQTYEAETFTTKNNYFDLESTGHLSQYEFGKQTELSKELQKKIVDYAQTKGIMIFSAPSHVKDLELMEEMNIPIYKIGSDLACHIPLLKKVAKLGKPIILSTGMCTLEEVSNSISTIKKEGNNQVIVMHCISNYPSKMEELNLKAIQTMKDEFNLPVGFSDHTIGSLAVLTSTIMGANIIEKHFRDPLNASSADDEHSLVKNEFLDLISSIRQIEKSLGSGKKLPTESEKKHMLSNRVSIIAMTKIPKGTKITEEMIDVRRPGDGIQPIHFEKILGKKAVVDIPKEMPIKWNMIE